MDITAAVGISAESTPVVTLLQGNYSIIILKNHAKKFDFFKFCAIIFKNKYGYERHTWHLLVRKSDYGTQIYRCVFFYAEKESLSCPETNFKEWCLHSLLL